MKTRINLYLPQLRPQKDLYSLKNVMITWCIACAICVTYIIVQSTLIHGQQKRLSNLKAQVTVSNKKLAEVTEQLEQKQDKTGLTQELKLLEEQMRNQQLLINFVKTKQAVTELDYAAVMSDLAKQSSDNLWLTEFKFYDQMIVMKGATTQAQAVPRWLEGLKKSQYFAGKQFSVLELKQQETSLSFEVATVKQGLTP